MDIPKARSILNDPADVGVKLLRLRVQSEGKLCPFHEQKSDGGRTNTSYDPEPACRQGRIVGARHHRARLRLLDSLCVVQLIVMV
jgi:hypothetical protein